MSTGRKPYQIREFVDQRVEISKKYTADGRPVPFRFRKRRRTCVHCGSPATKEALFDGGGIIVVEKYCDECVNKFFRFDSRESGSLVA